MTYSVHLSISLLTLIKIFFQKSSQNFNAYFDNPYVIEKGDPVKFNNDMDEINSSAYKMICK